MENITGNEPAFATLDTLDSAGLSYGNGFDGLTKREYFAAMAKIPWDKGVDILVLKGVEEDKITLGMISELIAKYKVLEADALIAELNKNI